MESPERRQNAQEIPHATANDLLQQVTVGVFAMDAKGICTHVNPAAARMFGYEIPELVGANLHSLLHGGHAGGNVYEPGSRSFLNCASAAQETRNANEVLWTKSGDPVPVFGSALPLSNGEGTVITIQDGSSLRHLQERLEHAQHEQVEVLRQRDAAARIERDLAREKELHQREIAVATERAATQQLRAQQRAAEDRLLQSEKLAAVGRLAASISHEINNPLEAVTNLLYLVRNDPSISAESNEYLRTAETELARVSQIVSQTLRFQRAGTSPTEIIPETLIDSVLSLHQGRLHHRRIQIRRRHRPSPIFRCAEGDVRQILNNLVGNAIDAMGSEGGTLTLRTTPARDQRTGQPGIRILVSDTGHGMPRHTSAHIFDPFYTTKGAKGSGLGLWISSTLANRMGGRIAVRSRTGGGRHGGTTFSVFIPEAVDSQLRPLEDERAPRAA
ncbi:nitrogen regulation protein NR(II) [Terriglobus sp. TAA 43]|uniref:two-component system sensor histidine kinase NtrB n=1 Tax=Terriglobus sp. TAA 43 TaxID=278961 RepID=UPI00068FBE9F|nr:ATP-binding protein [Terriglobus sp. TAA 43]